MSRRHGATATIAAGLITMGGLVGCSEDGGDEPPDSGLPSKAEVSESAPPATETTPAAASRPELPDEATRPGRAGARAFVTYYVALENYASNTGDADPLVEFSHPECGGCSDYIRFYRKWYERGGWFKEGHWRIRTYKRIAPSAPPHDIYVHIEIKMESGTYRARRHTPIERGRAESFDLLFWLLRGSDGWQVSRLDTPS